MYYTQITNKTTGEILRVLEEDSEFEYVSPIKHYKDSFIVKRMIENNVPQEQLDKKEKISDESKTIFIQSIQAWNTFHDGIKNLKLSQNLIKLLSAQKKKEQIQLLRNLELSPETLLAFLFLAEKEGYTLSQYKGIYKTKEFSDKIRPIAYGIINSMYKIFGKTELTEKQVKHLQSRKNYIIGKFLDKGDEWHCFFVTFKSLSGQELFLGKNQPHYHYISDKFNISREKVIADIKSSNYSLGSLPHIKLVNYGNQPK